MTAFVGISTFAGSHPRFPVGEFLSQYPDGMRRPAIALLPGSFGWDRRILEAFRSKFSGTKYLIQVHVASGPGRRRGGFPTDFLNEYSISRLNGALERGEEVVKAKIRRRAKKIQGWLYPDGIKPCNERLAISYELEDNLSDAAWRTFAWIFDEAFEPDYIEVRNPCKGGGGITSRKGTAVREHHGARVAAGMFWNMDGLSVDLKDDSGYDNVISPGKAEELMRTARKICQAGFFWHHDQQGWHDVKNFQMTIPPMDREFIITKNAVRTFRKIFERVDD